MKIKAILALILISASAFAGDTNWLPIGVKKSDWQTPATKDIILTALCEFVGVPNNDTGKADVMVKLQPALVTNVVGSVAQGITAGADYFVSANSCENYMGQNTAWAQDKLNRLKDSAAKDYILLGEWTGDTNAWLGVDYWGLVSQEEPPE